MERKYRSDPLNKQASVLVDAQTDIKTTIKNGVLNGTPFYIIQERTRKIIEQALLKITSSTLRQDARKSLFEFSNRVYVELKRVFPNALQAIAIYTLVKNVTKSVSRGDLSMYAKTYIPKTQAEINAFNELYGDTFRTEEKGLPLQEFQKDYLNKVSNALDNLANQRALDPNDVSGRNSLRNLAEMQVRYERHLEDIDNFKKDGVKLVICSTHGDCSERCSKWQGRVYSLDGTSGKTKDGRKFVPLEEATDIYYTTKAGRTYKNGLLGFNCRHYLTPYREGMAIPYVSKEEQAKEREITSRQRELERKVVYWREKALAQKGNAVEYKKARKKAIEWNKRYMQYSKDNGRAFYPDRVKIL